MHRLDLPLLLLVAAGLLAAVLGAWRPGLVVAGAALAVAGLLRLLLPPGRLGALAVRARPFDAVTLLAVGVALAALAIGLPGG